MNPHEEQIWVSIQKKDEQVFENYYKEHYKLFFLTACQYLKDVALAQEVVNDIFLKLWNDADTIAVQSSLKAYIYRAVVNRCLNELDKSRRDERRLGDLARLSEQYAESRQMEDNELKVRLYGAIDQLPEQCRKVFVMSRFEGMKQKEIATSLQISIKTVKNHITYALKQLHKVLGDWQSLPVWIGIIKYFFRR